MRRWIGLCGAAALTICGSPASALPTQHDWCAPVAVRPDRRTDAAGGAPVWRPDEVANVRFALIGTLFDVPGRGAAGARSYSHETNEAFAARVRQRAAPGREPVRFVHMHRFELVSPEWATLPGFDPSFLVDAATDLATVEAFFAADRTGPCRQDGCRFRLERWDGSSRRPLSDLTTRVDAAEPGRHRRLVYYLGRPGPGDREFGPVAALADLGNAEYRRWRVEAASRAVEQGGYDAVMLNHKLPQYRAPFWLGSERYPDVETIVAKGGTPWTTAARDLDYARYVAGWTALAGELRAAGVPYAVWLTPHPYLDRWDDEKTPAVDERALLLSAIQGARYVLLDRASLGPEGSLEPWLERMQEGPLVQVVDSSCGLRESTAP